MKGPLPIVANAMRADLRCQFFDLFSTRRQHLLPSLNSEVQAQAIRLSLLGLQIEGTSSRNTEIR